MSQNFYWMYGAHAVRFALDNMQRKIHELVVLDGQDYDDLIAQAKSRKIPVQITRKIDFGKLVGQDWVHQGVLAKCEPLRPVDIESVEGNAFLVLDQVTDPHNVGAILRTAAAFGISGVIMQDKNSATETGTLAKTACGALEVTPIIHVVNLSRTLSDLKEDGFWIVGLDERGDQTVTDIDFKGKIVIVMGAEGSGMRKLIRESCDFLARLPTLDNFPTLNVSTATAITLYEWNRQNS